MIDDGTLAAIGAGIVGFGIVAFVFRVQRELQRPEYSYVQREPRAGRPPSRAELAKKTGQSANWLPWADRLLIGAVTAAILLVLFPIALAGSVSSLWGEQLPAAACSGSAIALAGYIPALLAHYGFPGLESAERVIVIASVVLGVAAAGGSFFLTS